MQTLRTVIPPANLAAVENALLQTFNTTAVKEITLLAGGLSESPVFKILVNDQHFVLKIHCLTDSINDQLLNSVKIAADAGVAPPVYYLNKELGITITGFIKNSPLQTVFKSPDMLLPQLAKAIRSIHDLPSFPSGDSVEDTVERLIAQFKISGMLTGPVLDECFACYALIRTHYPWHDIDKVSSHNDLNPNNIVFDGEKIWIIDWDVASMNDRYVDLAIMANFYVATDEQENIFLGAYFGDSLTDYHGARFFLMRQVCRLVYAMLMFKLASVSKPADIAHNNDMSVIGLKEVKEKLRDGTLSLAAYEGQLLFGKALLNKALNNMRSSRFAFSLRQLGASIVGLTGS